MILSTKDIRHIIPFFHLFRLPDPFSHKGKNGRVLIIGGSSLFHSALIWAAETAAYFVDMVHVATTRENQEAMIAIKSKWHEGIVVPFAEVERYVEEDDVVLVGNGMMRSTRHEKRVEDMPSWKDILHIRDEGVFTQKAVEYLIHHFPHKQFVFDAGSLQTMEPSLMKNLKLKPLITPHQKEFSRLFEVDIQSMEQSELIKVAEKKAQAYSCIILLKAIDDIITDGIKTVVVQGGNAGLTKGGTGDILAGLSAGLITHSDVFSAAVLASYVIKKTAEELFEIKGFWYSATDVLRLIPVTVFQLVKKTGRLI